MEALESTRPSTGLAPCASSREGEQEGERGQPTSTAHSHPAPPDSTDDAELSPAASPHQCWETTAGGAQEGAFKAFRMTRCHRSSVTSL